MNTKEYEIPAPWGTIAAKAWGDENDPHVLCYHGILDNAGSFNRLIPQLPKCFYYIAIDLPGHGRSSHFPPNLPLLNIDNILVYIIVSEYFKKDKYIIIGHSYGGQLGIFYAQLYPEKVEKLIMLDTVYMFPIEVAHFREYMLEKYEEFLTMDKKLKSKQQPEYTYEEAFDKIQNQRNYGHINSGAAKALIERAIRPTPNGKYQFTVDQRLKNFMRPYIDFRYLLDNLKANPVKCPVLIILGNESKLQQIFMRRILNAFKKNRLMKIVKVDGDHDVHNTNPENVAPHITKFLIGRQSKL